MKYITALLLITSCATTNKYAYEESNECPSRMTNEQRMSGMVRCRALCASYAREVEAFDSNTCNCYCRGQVSSM